MNRLSTTHLRTHKRRRYRHSGRVSNAYQGHREAPGLNPPPEADVEALREKARQIKLAKGFSIQDLVMRSGLSQTAVLDMLNGRGHIKVGRVDSWWRLALALDVPIAELMAALDNRPTRPSI